MQGMLRRRKCRLADNPSELAWSAATLPNESPPRSRHNDGRNEIYMALTDFKETPKQAEVKDTLTVSARAAIADGNVIIAFPVKELDNAKRAKNGAGELGFMMPRMTVQVGDLTLTLRPGWCGLKVE